MKVKGKKREKEKCKTRSNYGLRRFMLYKERDQIGVQGIRNEKKRLELWGLRDKMKKRKKRNRIMEKREGDQVKIKCNVEVKKKQEEKKIRRK